MFIGRPVIYGLTVNVSRYSRSLASYTAFVPSEKTLKKREKKSLDML